VYQADRVCSEVPAAAGIYTAGDNACLMHSGGGLSGGVTGVRTAHIAEILAATEAAP